MSRRARQENFHIPRSTAAYAWMGGAIALCAIAEGWGIFALLIPYFLIQYAPKADWNSWS